MLSINKNLNDDSLKQASSYMIAAQLLSMIVSFFIHIINTRLLGPEQYGIFILYISALSVLSGFEAGISSAITKYVAEFHATNNLYKEHSAIHTGVLFDALLIVGFYLLFCQLNTSSEFFVSDYGAIFLLIIIISSSLSGILGSIIIAKRRLRFFSLLQFFSLIIYLTTICIFYFFFSYNLFYALLAFVCYIVFKLILSFVFIKKLYSNALFKLNSLLIGLFFNYSVPVMFSAFIMNFIINGGPLILKYLGCNFMDLGYFGVLLSLGNKGRSLLSSFYKSVFPYIVDWYATGRFDKIFSLIMSVLIGFVLLALVLSFFLFNYSKVFILMLYGSAYEAISGLLLMTAIVFLLISMKDFFSTILNALNFHFKNSFLTFVCLLTFVTGLFVYKNSQYILRSILISMGFAFFLFNCLSFVIIIRELSQRTSDYS